MINKNFEYTFTTSRKAIDVFEILKNPLNWWVGLFSEKIEGTCESVGQEFSFKAGDGIHYSNQKMIELIENEKIAWLVTQSHLSFLQNTEEWVGTKISFTITQQENLTCVTFYHEGLIPKIECYGSCSGAWMHYLSNLEKQLN
jgi:Activator of Hsp90 ATPase homolog 1-like protein